MAESFLTLMADYDGAAQSRLDGWYQAIQQAGFTGTQTPGLNHHISLATFPLEAEDDAVALARRVASEFAPVEVHVSHIGMFSGGRVLFAAPDVNPALAALQAACGGEFVGAHPWTPHTTMLIDEPARIQAALPTLVGCFQPFRGRLTHLHLCAFWPTREILTVKLTGTK